VLLFLRVHRAQQAATHAHKPKQSLAASAA
jgi:hypothetical protein